MASACTNRDKPDGSPLAGPTRHFASPEEAAAALVDATGRFDVPALTDILGQAGLPLFTSEDEVLDRQRARDFAEQAHAALRIERDSTGHLAIISVGRGDWPLPIPVVDNGGEWTFDAVAGVHEVLLRRIGENEQDAIEAVQGYVAAQRAYASERHDGARINQYAQRIVSTPGKRDGLAWQAPDGGWQGPIGEAIGRAIAEGYGDRSEPVHGYYFKVLKGQGPNALNGAIDFVVKGAMIGGFGLVAAPADYRVTGVKTFIVNQDGVVYEKDLGEGTVEAFKAMTSFDPDSTWHPTSGN